MTYPAERTQYLVRSVIQQVAGLAREHGALNLAEGFPDFPAPQVLVEEACKALRDGVNQYFPADGDPLLKQAIVEDYHRRYGLEYCAKRHLVVTSGATQATASTIQALVNPGDEVIVFQPFYENYIPNILFAGGIPKVLSLEPPLWRLPFEQLVGAVSAKTKLLILNTPHNPTGHVLSIEECRFIASLAAHFQFRVLVDEVYEFLTHDGLCHLPLASFEGLAHRVVTVSAVSKRYNVTGWRVGWALTKDERLMQAIQTVNDYMTAGAPSPLQRACVKALTWSFQEDRALHDPVRSNLQLLKEALPLLGLSPSEVCLEGSYFAFMPVDGWGFSQDMQAVEALIRQAGVGVVPGLSFFHPKGVRPTAQPYIRFTYSKQQATVQEALVRMMTLVSK
ncbi:MAG: pyridoxal phosphate-dependent aminotransferase [Vampirovibrionales bacterium]